MSRVKTFVADGTAPNGRLYAGDLNLLQDQYADLANFGQTHDVGTLRVGDSALQILKYGAGELRMTSALRTDGILRALGGVYAGAFTTTQRDAIASGFAPYGLIILNTTKNTYEWNNGSDVSRSWVPLGQASTSSFATMPAPGQAGRTWYDSTNKLLWLDLVTRWMVLDGQIGDFVFYSGPVTTLSGVQEIKPGRLLCNGASALQSAYPELRTLWGAAAYGADPDGTHFLLPNALGRVMVVRDGSVAPFDTLGETGGETAHTLTIPEIPAHAHDQHAQTIYHDLFEAAMDSGSAEQEYSNSVTPRQTSTVGGGGSHNNLQPYLVVGAMLVKY